MNYKVSSHAPVRGHQSVLGAGRDGYSGFKSCPREGASVLSGLFRRSAHVSSHAPVRGHLPRYRLSTASSYVSSHAPVRGHLYS